MTHAVLSKPIIPTAALVASAFPAGTATVVALRGEADVFTLPVIVDALARVIADHDGPIVVDLTEVTFIDIRGIRALARAAQFAGDRGRELTLRSPSRMALRLLTLLEVPHLIQPTKPATP